MEYLYRVTDHEKIIYQGTDGKGANLIVDILKKKDKVDAKLERAELVWWSVPPEKTETGTT